MRKLFFTFFGTVTSLFLMVGCASTHSIVTEYDAGGNIVKKTESTESVIKTVTASTQGKTLLMWEDGWAAYISISSGTLDDPMPHGKIFAGKISKGAFSILPNQQGLPGIAKIVQATKSDFSADLSGVNSNSSEIQNQAKDKEVVNE